MINISHIHNRQRTNQLFVVTHKLYTMLVGQIVFILEKFVKNRQWRRCFASQISTPIDCLQIEKINKFDRDDKLFLITNQTEG